MATQKIDITTPVGRLVGGDLYTAKKTDANGQPLVIKRGPNMGQPRVDFWFALAIPKEPGQTHWAIRPPSMQTPENQGKPYWGEQIWQYACQAWPQYVQSPAFAWKIEDGDDATPNPMRKGRRNCDAEGYKGHWIVKFSGGFAPKIYVMEGTAYRQVLEQDFCKLGHYVQVQFSVKSNESDQKPGLHINHGSVCHRGYGPEISFGPDVAAAGFGAAPLPAGASLMPLAGSAPMPMMQQPNMMPQGAPMMQQPNGVPVMAGMAPSPLGGSAQMPQNLAQTAAVQIPVMPSPQFLQVPPPNAGKQMTALGVQTFGTYENALAAQWNDVALVQQGYMTA